MRRCSHCDKEITKYPHIYIGIWQDYRNNSVVYYHVECFEEIAGEAYTTELRACPTPDVPNIDE